MIWINSVLFRALPPTPLSVTSAQAKDTLLNPRIKAGFVSM